MQHQGQQQNQNEHEGIHHADGAGINVSPVLRHAVNRVQSGEQAVNAPAGRPQRRHGGNAHHCAGGIAVGAVDQLLGSLRHGTGQDVVQQLHQTPHLHSRIAQHAENQHQRREHGQHNKVRGIGGVEGNMHLLDGLGGVHNFADQPALGKFLHRLPPLYLFR